MRQEVMRRSCAAGMLWAICTTAWTQAPAPASAPAATSSPSATPQSGAAAPATSNAPGPTPASSATPVPANQPAQSPPLQTASPQTSIQPVAGGKLHGAVKSGNIPLPGVNVTAQNTLTGKRFSTTTDVTGSWTLNIPQNGRYVVRTQF